MTLGAASPPNPPPPGLSPRRPAPAAGEPMDRRALISALNRLLELEYNSLVRYLSESDPWIPEESRAPMLDLLAELAEEELAHAEALAGQIADLGGAPLLGNFTPEVADLSYLSLGYTLRRILEWKSNLRGRYRQALAGARGWPEAALALSRLIEAEERHRRRLEAAFRQLNPGKEPPGDEGFEGEGI